MALDSQHQNLIFSASEIPHFYGERVHIASSPLMLSFLAKLGSTHSKQPEINELVSMLYSHLIDVVIDSHFPGKKDSIEIRMKVHYDVEIIDPNTPCVSVDLARAGTLPS